MEPLAEPKEDDDDSGGEDEDDEDSNGEAVVDRKGKGVLRDDRGKGKLIEEDEDDDDDDDSDDNVSDSVSDFSDDPLAEVDLNNILPSRTQPPWLNIAALKLPQREPQSFVAQEMIQMEIQKLQKTTKRFAGEP